MRRSDALRETRCAQMSDSLANGVELLAARLALIAEVRDDAQPLLELERALRQLVSNYRRRRDEKVEVRGFRVFKRIESADGVGVWFCKVDSVDTFGVVLDSAPLEHFATGVRFKLVRDE
jgi:hypothetical protein